jgi:thiol-disulfide isomerase/thioredoxin
VTLPQRLIALTGLAAIVGAALALLTVLGVLGGGDGVEPVRILEPPRGPGQETLAVGVEPGQLAPDFEISDFDGVRHRLSDFRGKVVYLNFWATWCLPCGIELPDIDTIEERHAGELAVIAVNRRQSVETAREWLAGLPRKDGGKGVSFTVNAVDPTDALYDRFARIVPPPMPVSIFIDAEGVVRRAYYGLVTIDQMEEAVNEALAAPSTARAAE